MRYDVSYKRFDRKRKVPSLRYGKPCDKLLGIINEVEYKRYLYSKDLMFGMYFVDIKWIEAKKKKKMILNCFDSGFLFGKYGKIK